MLLLKLFIIYLTLIRLTNGCSLTQMKGSTTIAFQLILVQVKMRLFIRGVEDNRCVYSGIEDKGQLTEVHGQ